MKPNIERGNLYTPANLAKYDHVGFTSNGVLKNNGALVMGAGNAKVVRDMFVGIDKRLGDVLRQSHTPKGGVYNYRIVLDTDTNIFALQTKLHWRDNTPMDLLKLSISLLERSALARPHQTFACPLPGIDRGGIDRDVVVALLADISNLTWFEL